MIGMVSLTVRAHVAFQASVRYPGSHTTDDHIPHSQSAGSRRTSYQQLAHQQSCDHSLSSPP